MLFFNCEEEGNAEVGEDRNMLFTLVQVSPRYNEQKNWPNLFRIGHFSSGGSHLTAVTTLYCEFELEF
jgi:hypothetical protein